MSKPVCTRTLDATDSTIEAVLAGREGYTKPLPRRGGRPRNVAVAILMKRFGVTRKQVYKAGPAQLMACKDNASIRLLLGISR
jgi:hypothetical protein